MFFLQPPNRSFGILDADCQSFHVFLTGKVITYLVAFVYRLLAGEISVKHYLVDIFSDKFTNRSNNK